MDALLALVRVDRAEPAVSTVAAGEILLALKLGPTDRVYGLTEVAAAPPERITDELAPVGARLLELPPIVRFRAGGAVALEA